MKSVDEHIDSIGARAEHCESHGWARDAPAHLMQLKKEHLRLAMGGGDAGLLF